MLQAGLSAGFCSAGIDVYDLGVLPTPAIAWLTANSAAIAGVVISASHNPAPDNGIKFLDGRGFRAARCPGSSDRGPDDAGPMSRVRLAWA